MLTKQIITKEFYDEQGRLTRKITEENHFDDTMPLEPKWSEYPNDWPPTPITCSEGSTNAGKIYCPDSQVGSVIYAEN